MSKGYTHSLIREMERSGCELEFHANTDGGNYYLTVHWRGWKTVATKLNGFPIERAYAEWVEYRDSNAWRVLSNQDQPQSAVIPQELPKVAKRVRGRSGTPTPHVAETVAQEQAVEKPKPRRKPRKRVPPKPVLVAPEPVLSERMSLRDRLKLRNQKEVA